MTRRASTAVDRDARQAAYLNGYNAGQSPLTDRSGNPCEDPKLRTAWYDGFDLARSRGLVVKVPEGGKTA